MFETFRNAWKIEDLRKKLLYTLLVIVIFRLGCAIPVPFIAPEALQGWVAGQSGSMLGYIDMLTGGSFSRATLFALSVTPYINASIIIQLLTVAIPALERLSKEGEDGRKKLTRITRYTGAGIALALGIGYYFLLRGQGALVYGSGAQMFAQVFSAIVVILAFTAGSLLIQWLGEQIDVKGIGNGISILIFAGIVSRWTSIFTTIKTWLGLAAGGEVKYYFLIPVLVVLAVAVVVFIVILNAAERRIPVQYAKRVVGRKMYGGQSTHLPIKVNASGVMPIIFASSILALPQTVSMFWQPEAGTVGAHILNLFSQRSVVYIVLYALLILAFAYFYASIQFNPIEIANNLKKNGGFIPGFRPGKPTSDFITKALGKVTFVGAVFLGIVALVPLIVGAISTNLSNVALGGTSVIIVVGVALDTVKQMEAQMLMRHHKGFLE